MTSFRPQNRKGIALVFVLMLVVLVTIMVVAFFASVKTEASATRATVGVQNSRQLADLATQIVMAQIQQATQTSSTRLPGTVAWASQPGMIRCYDNTGKDIEWYKLYSAQNVTAANPTINGTVTLQQDLPEAPGAASTAGNWATSDSLNYGVFTDLNSPVIASDGTTLEYPIMNPAAATSVATSSSGTLSNLVYGFDIQPAPGYNSTSTSSANNNQAAMPVRWLYVLQDGTMVPGTSSGTAGTVLVSGATSSNPIVGRVAFWTDDDTCKININTAADGTYFDSPRFQNGPFKSSSTLQAETGVTQDSDRVLERQLAVTPPVGNEYQRYVGHPAQTRLSFVLPSIYSNLNGVGRSQSLSQISPFTQWGGSQGGVINAYDFTPNGGTLSPALATPKRQTPYATLDEWMFSTSLTGTTRVANTDLNGNALLSNTRLQQLRFFLSANSEAPEVNLFGQPRICMYPIYTPTLATNALPPLPDSHVSTFDQLIATAATLTGTTSGSTRAPGGTATVPYTYYLGRQNSASPYVDFDGAAATTAISSRPAINFSGAGSNTRNQNLFVFLRTLASHNIPGYGFSFTSKYTSAGMDQIITEIMDYIRSSNANDPLVTTPYNNLRLDAITATNGTLPYAGKGQVTPLIIPATAYKSINGSNGYSTQGFGRFFTVNEITLNFTQSQTTTFTVTGTVDPSHVTITPVIYLGLFSPSVGPTELTPDMRIEIAPAGLGALTLNGMYMYPGTSNTTTSGTIPGPYASSASVSTFSVIPITGSSDNFNSQYEWHMNAGGGGISGAGSIFLWGGAVGSRFLYAMKNPTYRSSPAQASPGGNNGAAYLGSRAGQSYMFSGVPLNVSNTGSFVFNGGPIVIKVYHNASQANSTPANDTLGPNIGGEGYSGLTTDLVQTITVTLPAIKFMKTLTSMTGTASLVNDYMGDGFWGVSDYDNYGGSYPFTAKDFGVSLVSNYNGDMRMLAAQHNITVSDVTTSGSSAFVMHSGTTVSGNTPSFTISGSFVHSLRDPFFSNYFHAPPSMGFTSTGQLVNPASATTSSFPSVVGNITSYPTTRDWDNGLGVLPDGPYINKPDEAGYQYNNYNVPYYTGGLSGNTIATTLASPNRIMASPVMFGSLPTGVPLFTTTGATVLSATPWRTLLFRPQAGHPGGNNSGTTIADETLLDWFWMPVVEPYAISTPLATAGKVNMNYQIVPFTYITRATAQMAVLGSEYVISAANGLGGSYKDQGTNNTGGGIGNVYRYPVKVLETTGSGYALGDSTGSFRQFKDRFASGEIFRSAAEICDIYLVPQGQSWNNWSQAGSPNSGTDAETYWNNNLLTGDNTRERPYNGLYSRLTTKSNTYTIHVKAQALKQPQNTPAGKWIENSQQIVSEYRGSVTINRYLDPQDTTIPDFLSTGTNYPVTTGAFAYSLDNYYKYRVLETRQFLP